MKRLMVFVVALSLIGCAGGTESVECWIGSLEADSLVFDTVEVEVGFEGPVDQVELMVGGDVVATAEVPADADGTVMVSWDTTAGADGSAELTAHAVADGSDHTSEAVAVIVDNTAPVVSLDVDRFAMLEGTVELPVTLEEANVASFRLFSEHGDLMTAEDLSDSISWDTTGADSRAHRLSLEVTDAAGHTATTEAIPVVVINGGEEIDVVYDPSSWIIIPEPFDPTAEVHTRSTALMTDRPVGRIISWLTWDATSDWLIEYTVGQGICPHRGVAYHGEENRDGEILIDLAWTDIEADIQNQSLEFDTDYPEGGTCYPYNGEITTCGAFFGHIADMEPADHAGQELEVEVHYIFIYES